MDHCFEQAIFIVLVCSNKPVFVGFLYLCVDLCSVFDYFDADKGDLAVNRKLHRKR